MEMIQVDQFDFFTSEERETSQQWDQANIAFTRQISLDYSETNLWNHLGNSSQQISISQENLLVSNTLSESQTQPERIVVEEIEVSDTSYEKNICAYITKKAVQCLLASTYKRAVEKLCVKNGCKYVQIEEYYGQRFKEVFGITHLTLLITPQQHNQIRIKQVFRVYLKWFLKEKYMLYLLKYGKMTKKQKYVEFKNKFLLYIDEQTINFKNY